MIGSAGKWPWKNHSLIVTCLMPTARSKRSHLDHTVDEQERIAVRDHLHHRIDVRIGKLRPGRKALLAHLASSFPFLRAPGEEGIA